VGDLEPTMADSGTTHDRRRFYIVSTTSDRLWQGEILSDLLQAKLSLGSLEAASLIRGETEHQPQLRVELDGHPLIVVLSQDCDLEKDFKGRREGRPFLFNVLLCDIHPAEELHQNLHREESTGSKEWRTIRENGTPRFQFLSAVPPDQDASGIGFPDLAIDFRFYFTMRTDELYERLKLRLTTKRCKLQTPYVEHLAHRFYSYQSRVALPVDHPTP
jgi:hypothetical protein